MIIYIKQIILLDKIIKIINILKLLFKIYIIILTLYQFITIAYIKL